MLSLLSKSSASSSSSSSEVRNEKDEDEVVAVYLRLALPSSLSQLLPLQKRKISSLLPLVQKSSTAKIVVGDIVPAETTEAATVGGVEEPSSSQHDEDDGRVRRGDAARIMLDVLIIVVL